LTAIDSRFACRRLTVDRRAASQGKTTSRRRGSALAGFFSVAIMMSLLIFSGEAVRDAFDPRRPYGKPLE